MGFIALACLLYQTLEVSIPFSRKFPDRAHGVIDIAFKLISNTKPTVNI